MSLSKTVLGGMQQPQQETEGCGVGVLNKEKNTLKTGIEVESPFLVYILPELLDLLAVL